MANDVAIVIERDDTGRVSQIPVRPWATQLTDASSTPKVRNTEQLRSQLYARSIILSETIAERYHHT